MTTFVPTDWRNGPAGDTPITAEQLNRIEAAIQAALDAAAAAHDSAASTGVITLPAPTDDPAIDHPAILAAIAQAVAAGGGLIVGRSSSTAYALGAGRHVFPNGVSLQGQGGGSTSTRGRTRFRCTAPTSGFEFAGGSGLSGHFELDGNSVATLPFRRTGGIGANARLFVNMTVHHNAPAATPTNDLCQFWGAQNDYYEQCGFAYADRDLAWFDQGFGGVTFNRCEWSGTVGRYWHRYDNQIAGGVGQAPFNIVHMGTNNIEGGSEAGHPLPVSHVKMNAGVDITYDKAWFYSVSGTSGPSIDVGTGCIINLHSPSLQSKPSGTPLAGSKAIQVSGTGRVTITGRAQYLNFEKPMNIDGIAAHIFDNTPPEFYNCGTPRFTGSGGATTFQWENDSGGLRTNAAAATDPVEITYNAARSAILAIRRGDATQEFYPGTGFGGATAKWGPRAGGYAVGVNLGAGTPVCIGGGTTAARDATWPASAALAGAMFYNTDTQTIDLCNGAAWFNPGGGGGAGAPVVRDLPPYAPASPTHAWNALESFYNASSATLHGQRAAQMKLVNDQADIHYAAAGDSVLGGYDGTGYTFEHCIPRVIGKQLAKAIGVGFCGGIQLAVADTANRVANNVTKGGWTSAVAPFPALGSTAAGQTCSVVTLDPGTTLDVLFWDNAPAGLTWTIDGVAQTPFAPGGTDTVQKVTVAGLDNKVHTVAFTSTAAGQKILGWWARNPAIKQIYAHVLSLGGSVANAAPANANWSDMTAGATPGLGWIIQQILAVLGVTPTATLVSAAGNDLSGGGTPANAQAGVATILGYAWLGATKTYLHIYKPIAALLDATWDDFSGRCFTQCDASGASMFDLDHYLNRRPSAAADGLIGADGTHLTVALQRAAGRQVAKLWATGLVAAELVQVRVESGGAYAPRYSTGISPAGKSFAFGADTPPDAVDGDAWADLP